MVTLAPACVIILSFTRHLTIFSSAEHLQWSIVKQLLSVKRSLDRRGLTKALRCLAVRRTPPGEDGYLLVGLAILSSLSVLQKIQICGLGCSCYTDRAPLFDLARLITRASLGANPERMVTLARYCVAILSFPALYRKSEVALRCSVLYHGIAQLGRF